MFLYLYMYYFYLFVCFLHHVPSLWCLFKCSCAYAVKRHVQSPGLFARVSKWTKKKALHTALHFSYKNNQLFVDVCKHVPMWWLCEQICVSKSIQLLRVISHMVNDQFLGLNVERSINKEQKQQL